MKRILDSRAALQAGPAIVGGKAYALAQMSAAGFDVPPFLVLLPEAVAAAGPPGDVPAGLELLLPSLPGERFAVRSSARSEDGAADSHAGQFKTVLDVAREDIAAAAREVVASGRAQSVAAYRNARGLEGVDLPAVVVQAMIPARVAGVAFAADPVSGRRDRVVVSAIAGLGDALVSGEENGEMWTLTGPDLEPVARPAGASALTENEARLVARLCLDASKAQHAPQDIEWAFDARRRSPWLLQARPITSCLLPKGNPESKLLVFDNSNIVESYPGVVAPLTFSFAIEAYSRVYRTFLSMVGVSPAVVDEHAAELANMLSRIDGRMYYNLGNWYRLLSLLPFFSRNRRYMESMMGVSSSLPDEAMAGVAPSRGGLATLRMAARLGLQALRLSSVRDAFMARIGGAVPARENWAKVSQTPLSELANEYRRIEAALLDRWDAPIINDFLCMIAFGASRALLERWAGPAGTALHNDVMIGQGDIISAEPARLIREIGALARATPGALELLETEDRVAIFESEPFGARLAAYVAKFGDRRIGELKLEQPTLDDDPRPLFRAVLASASSASAAPRRADPDAELARLLARRPVRHFLAKRLLAYAKARVRDRENLRFERTRIFGYARRVFLAMGDNLAAMGLLASPDDIFLLTVDEALGTAEGSAVTGDLKGLVEVRRRERESHLGLRDPPERILQRGSVIDGSSRLTLTPEVPVDDNLPDRRGTACGGGVVAGTARVVRDPSAEQVLPGEILVARHTDPGWISHFANAAAVVAERGSVLSHSAIVSRELGIPCVVAVANACTWIRTGDRIVVDGTLGIVRKSLE